MPPINFVYRYHCCHPGRVLELVGVFRGDGRHF